MKIEQTEIFGFRAAFRGMRNPFDSWEKSDSYFTRKDGETINVLGYLGPHVSPTRKDIFRAVEEPIIGEDDLKLACRLINQGGDHRKFLRMIVVWCDITIPRYVWQEVDTYKVGTVRNSCSTMNTLGKRPLGHDDFENPLPQPMLDELNKAIEDFKEADGSKAKRAERVTMKDLLPEGFLQKATFMLNYEVGLRMFFSRRRHRLPMWREGCVGSICEWIKSWPYMGRFLEAEADRRK